MMRVLPPNRTTVKETAKMALKYLNDEDVNIDLVKLVIQNVIHGLECPDFDKDGWEATGEKWTITTT
jgi:hypothetical protein